MILSSLSNIFQKKVLLSSIADSGKLCNKFCNHILVFGLPVLQWECNNIKLCFWRKSPNPPRARTNFQPCFRRRSSSPPRSKPNFQPCFRRKSSSPPRSRPNFQPCFRRRSSSPLIIRQNFSTLFLNKVLRSTSNQIRFLHNAVFERSYSPPKIIWTFSSGIF